jgi:hypothetical protein
MFVKTLENRANATFSKFVVDGNARISWRELRWTSFAKGVPPAQWYWTANSAEAEYALRMVTTARRQTMVR